MAERRHVAHRLRQAEQVTEQPAPEAHRSRDAVDRGVEPVSLGGGEQRVGEDVDEPPVEPDRPGVALHVGAERPGHLGRHEVAGELHHAQHHRGGPQVAGLGSGGPQPVLRLRDDLVEHRGGRRRPVEHRPQQVPPQHPGHPVHRTHESLVGEPATGDGLLAQAHHLVHGVGVAGVTQLLL